jgi:DNA-binding beta-propeller fold protein YncE
VKITRAVILLSACLLQQPLLAAPLEAIRSELPQYGLVKGPDGFYFTRKSSAFTEPGREQILRTGWDGESMAPPAWALPDYSESDAYFSPDGQKLCFVSNRPDPQDPHPGDADIWCSTRLDGKWNTARRLPEPVNSRGVEFSPVITAGGELYFASDRPGGFGLGDLYRAHQESDGRWRVLNLGPAINGAGGEWNLDVSPDGALLIFEASHRPSNLSRSGDLYLSVKTNAAWSTAVPLSRLNSRGSDLMARFIGDGDVIYASGGKDGVELKAARLEDFRPAAPALVAVSRSRHELVELDPETLAVRQRVKVGAGSHEVALSEDGRTAVLPSFGVFPRPHEQPITPKELRWVSTPSEGFTLVDLFTGERAAFPLSACLRPHGVAATPQADRLWITCEGLGELWQVEPQSGAVQRRFTSGKGTHKVIYLAGMDKLVASNPDLGEVILLDPESGKSSVIATGAGAEALAASADGSDLWVANSFDRTVCRISLPAESLEGCWPSGGAFPIALAVDETRGLIWIARSASSDLAALSLETLEPVHEINLPSRPLGMALDAHRGKVYLSLPRLNEIVRVDIASGTIDQRAREIMEADDLDLVPTRYFSSPPDS